MHCGGYTGDDRRRHWNYCGECRKAAIKKHLEDQDARYLRKMEHLPDWDGPVTYRYRYWRDIDHMIDDMWEDGLPPYVQVCEEEQICKAVKGHQLADVIREYLYDDWANEDSDLDLEDESILEHHLDEWLSTQTWARWTPRDEIVTRESIIEAMDEETREEYIDALKGPETQGAQGR
jgi:hypothetical protein